MINKIYEVKFEIAGAAAMFSRPDTGAAPISYPIPTWSAIKAMCESVTRGFVSPGEIPPAFFCPTEVEIWSPIRFFKYQTNYLGPMRKSEQIRKNSAYQLHATILVDVCYRVTCHCIPIPDVANRNCNASHALQEMFNRRVRQGKSKYLPSLGWKEFIPSYFGFFRDQDVNAGIYQLQEQHNEYIPAFLMTPWDAPINGQYQPIYRCVEISAGKAQFPRVSIHNGKLIFDGGSVC